MGPNESGSDFFAPVPGGGVPSTPNVSKGASSSSFGSAPPAFGSGAPTTRNPLQSGPPTRRPRNTRPKWVDRTIRLVIVAGIVLAAIVYIPKAHIPDRLRFYTSTVATPEAIAEIYQLDREETRTATPDASIPMAEGVGPAKTAVYQVEGGTDGLVVSTAKFTSPNLDIDESAAARMNEKVRTLTPNGGIGEFVEIPSGKYGGSVICAPITSGAAGRLCIAQSVTMHTSILFAGTNISDALVLQVREATEKRVF